MAQGCHRGDVEDEVRRILTCLAIVSSLVGASVLHAQQGWPALPSKGFIAGRAATPQDVAAGNAIFVAQKDGKPIGTPISITIPQYAYWTNEAGVRVPVIVVQAEEVNGMRLIGFRQVGGKDHVGTERELKLLGTTPPN